MTAEFNHQQKQKRQQQIKQLQKQHTALAWWINENINAKNWEEKVREYNSLSSQILAMEGKTKYIIIHQ